MNILWHFFGVGFILLGCWFYLRPHVIFGLTDSPFADKFIRGWSVAALFVGWYALLSFIFEVVPSQNLMGMVAFPLVLLVAGFMAWFTRKLLRSSLSAKAR